MKTVTRTEEGRAGEEEGSIKTAVDLSSRRHQGELMAAVQTVEVGEPEEAVLVETDIRTEGGEEAERSLAEVDNTGPRLIQLLRLATPLLPQSRRKL